MVLITTFVATEMRVCSMLYTVASDTLGLAIGPAAETANDVHEADPLLVRYFSLSRQAQRSQSMHVLNRSIVASRFLL